MKEPFKIAAVQASPVFLDREATVEKACALIAAAGREEARLIAFPESFIPAYPDWVWVVPSGRKNLLDPLYAELLAQSIVVPDESTRRLCEAARRAKAYVVIGLSELNAESSATSMYNTLMYIGPDGEVLGKHRKLVPTGGERLVWAQGDGSTLGVYETPLGTLGGLICWENYMPLARYAMYAWGTRVYVAATWDHGEPWLSTLRHIAKEGGVYVIGACTSLRKDDIPDRLAFKELYDQAKVWINPGDSVIVDPSGRIVAGPAHETETILYAQIDPKTMDGSKWILDVAGHYARPDVFNLSVARRSNPMIRSAEEGPETSSLEP